MQATISKFITLIVIKVLSLLNCFDWSHELDEFNPNLWSPVKANVLGY